MIINTDNNPVDIVGDVQEFKTGIDPKNLEFITTLLSSNLYSAPERSFIREIISNAWDSHVEANTTDIPVLVKIDNYNKSITIRDFGVGLSPERFKDIYCNIGSSTKRESNEFIGGFGIGRFSAVACSNTVYITSYYNGLAYHYIMIKNGNSINTNLVATIPTTEKNGVEVTIKNLFNLKPYYDALEYIAFFPNVYVDGYNKFNNIKIKRYNKYACCNFQVTQHILLGNVLYPVSNEILTKDNLEFKRKIFYSGIVFKFDIGELEVTPNRESIIYTEKTKSTINNRISEAKIEFYNNIKKHIKNSVDNIIEYSKYLSSIFYYIPIIDTVSEYSSEVTSFSFNVKDICSVYYKKTKDYCKYTDLLRKISQSYFPDIKCAITNTKIYSSGKMPYSVDKTTKITNDKVLVLNKETTLSIYLKEYLKANYDGYVLIYDRNKDSFKDYVTNIITDFNNYKKYVCSDISLDTFNYIIDEFYDCIYNTHIKIDFKTNVGFLTYKQQASQNKKDTCAIKDVILYIYSSKYSGSTYVEKYKYCYTTLEKALIKIKDIKSGVVINNITEDDFSISNVLHARNIVYITASKKIITELNKINIPNRIDLNTFLKSDKVLCRLSSLLNRNFEFLSSSILESIPIKDKDEIKEISDFVSKYSKYSHFACLARHSKCEISSYDKYVCEKIDFYNTKWNEAIELGGLENVYVADRNLFIRAIIRKRKLFRMNSSIYTMLQNNKLLNELCRK